MGYKEGLSKKVIGKVKDIIFKKLDKEVFKRYV